MKVPRLDSRLISQAIAAATVCLAMQAVTVPTAQADEPADRDLQGILPDYLPSGLSEEDFNRLKDNWADWAAETGRLVGDLYIADDDEVRGRRVTLEKVRVKLDTMKTALKDTQYLSIYGPLADLYGRLSRRIGVAEALLETVEQDVTEVSQQRFQSSLKELAAEAVRLREHLQGIIEGERWVTYLQLNEIAEAAQSGNLSDATVTMLEGVQEKLDSRTELEEPQRLFLSREAVLNFEDALGTSLDLLDAREPEGYRQYLRDLAGELLEAIEAYEGEPTTESMLAIRHTYDELRKAAPDGGAALTEAMRRHYLNYNLRVVMEESLMQDLIRDTRMESGFINDMIAGATVTGCQWTKATVNMDLKPSDTGVRFNLQLDGTIRSSAQGETHVATVYTSGQHSFTAQKSVYFDGDHFQHWCASVRVNGGNCPYAAETCLSWAPLLGGFTENLALSVANDRLPETNAYAINKIRREAGTKFDRETGKLLQEAELGMEDRLAGPLRQGGYYPDIKEFRSTETELTMRSRLMESGEIGGSDTLPMPIYPTHGVLVQIHESLLNQIGDRLDLEGKRFTPEELKSYLRAELESITGKPVDLSEFNKDSDPDPDSPKVEEIIFHEADAVRFQIRGGAVVLILSMGLKLEDREEIPPQRITVPLQLTLEGEKIQMERGTVGVSPIGPVNPRERAQQIARAGVMRNKIQEAFEPQEFDAIFTIALEKKNLKLKVTDLRPRAGWLSVIATDGISETGDSSGVVQPMQQASGQSQTIQR